MTVKETCWSQNTYEYIEVEVKVESETWEQKRTKRKTNLCMWSVNENFTRLNPGLDQDWHVPWGSNQDQNVLWESNQD